MFVGNLMIDSLHAARPRAVAPEQTLVAAGADPALVKQGSGYGVVTLHRPSNVDEPAALTDVLETLRQASRRLPLVWPMHPRTRASIDRLKLGHLLEGARIACLPPQGYLEMVGLMSSAAVVLTDSGGVQEETTALGVPCLTMRSNTERPITLEQGTNTLVGRDRTLILQLVDEILASGGKRGRTPELWDGHAADRIAAHFGPWLQARLAQGAQVAG